MKVLINACFGGFGLSVDAFEKLLACKGIAWEKQESKYGSISYYHAGHLGDDDHYLYDYILTENRADPDLIAIFEEMGHLTNGSYSRLKIVEVPDDVEWTIDEYDGKEWVAEKHRTWD
jgi:hypothetical protein